MKATLKQIADDCGLSISTVSRVVTGKGYVSSDARAQIEASIARLSYTKKERPQVVLKDASSLVMVLVGGIRSSLASKMVELLVQELELKQMRAFIAISEFNPEKELEFLRYAADNHFFGVFAMTLSETPENLAYLRTYPIPITLVNRYLPSLETDYLCADYYRMGYVGAEYLIRHGHKKIAFVGGSPTSPVTEDKLTGFQDCMRAYNLELRPVWCFHVNRMIYENGAQVVSALLALEERPTAIVSSNDISVGILNELIQHGIRVPEDISLFTCEDSNLTATCLIPITSMTLEMSRIAHDAVKLLIRRRRQPYAPRHFLIYTPRLVERSSVKSVV